MQLQVPLDQTGQNASDGSQASQFDRTKLSNGPASGSSSRSTACPVPTHHGRLGAHSIRRGPDERVSTLAIRVSARGLGLVY